MIFKRITAALTALLAVLCTLCGCVPDKKSGDKPVIVTTVFPIYDWVKNVLGSSGTFDVVTLLDGGVDMHSFTPGAKDVLEITESSLFIYIGGESDGWTDDVFGANSSESVRLSLMDCLEPCLLEEEKKEGMQDGDKAEETSADEHVWLSLRLAQQACDAICREICSLDEDNRELYTENCRKYKESLAALDGLYTAAVKENGIHTLIVCDRFPFLYLAKDYGIDYYAAFSGCSAESEAGFETIRFLASAADKLGVHTLFVTESSDGRIAQTVKNSMECKTVQTAVLDSMQSVTREQIENGSTYLGIMEKNLGTLKKAGNGTAG